MINTTRWRPDTCGCEIEYTWDTEASEEDRVHTVSNITKACDAHKNHPIETHFEKVVEENTSKNQVLSAILENYPELTVSDENGGKKLKQGVEYKWSFDKDRKLQVELVGAQIDSAELVSLGEATIGAGKLEVK